MIIVFHINDLILAHAHAIITTKYAKLLDWVHRTKDSLTATRAKIYEYHRMVIDFSLKIRCTIIQYDFAKKLQKDLDDGLKDLCRNNPAADL